MNNAEFRRLELHYRHNPSQIFASVEDLAKVQELATTGATKLDLMVANTISNLWTDQAGYIFLLFVRCALGFATMPNVNAEAMIRWVGRHLGNWAAQSPTAAKQFFGKVVEGLYLDRPNMDHEASLSSIAAVWFGLQHNMNILDNTARPTPPMTPVKMLYLAAGEGDQEACEMLDVIWGLMQLYHCKPMPWLTRDTHPSEAYWHPVPGCEEYVHWSDRNEKKLLKESGALDLVNVASKKMPQILSFIEALWTDILENARCGIREDGLDTFYFSGPWEKMHRAHRYFYTGELKFPDVGIAIAQDFGDGKVIWHQIEMTTAVKEECLSYGALGALPYLGNLIAYHAVVCQPPAKRSGKKTAQIKRPTTDVTPKYVIAKVRDYERTLPAGQRCSDDRATAFRLKYGHDITDGKTYVSKHERAMVPGQRLIEALPGCRRPNFSIDLAAIIEDLQ